ncbi:MAG: AIM24 family protein, partial [Calditrichaeota bacterium]|nr:AIM24 family protein [Calditrichota bacterium]
VELDSGEAVRAEVGAMMYMENGDRRPENEDRRLGNGELKKQVPLCMN